VGEREVPQDHVGLSSEILDKSMGVRKSAGAIFDSLEDHL
jgi:hypothetical protein